MKTRILPTAIILVLIAGFTAAVAQAIRNQATKEFMRDKLELSQRVLEGLATENYDLIRVSGARLSAMTRETDWRFFEHPDYDPQSLMFRRQVDALVKAAQDKNIDAATLAYVRLTMSCMDCHKLVRGKLVGAAPEAGAAPALAQGGSKVPLPRP